MTRRKAIPLKGISLDIHIVRRYLRESERMSSCKGASARGHTEGEQRGHNASGAEKFQQFRDYSSKYFLQYSTFVPETLGSNMGGAKHVSCPGRHLASVRPWLQRECF